VRLREYTASAAGKQRLCLLSALPGLYRFAAGVDELAGARKDLRDIWGTNGCRTKRARTTREFMDQQCTCTAKANRYDLEWSAVYAVHSFRLQHASRSTEKRIADAENNLRRGYMTDKAVLINLDWTIACSGDDVILNEVMVVFKVGKAKPVKSRIPASWHSITFAFTRSPSYRTILYITLRQAFLSFNLRTDWTPSTNHCSVSS
jgi:hypothetical protein